MENKIKCYVTSRDSFNRILTEKGISDDNVETHQYTKDLALISIHDNSEMDNQHFKMDHPNVLRLFFYDIEEDTNANDKFYNTFSDEQAKMVYEFVNKNINAHGFLVHCTAGISRSGAVGEWINDYIGGDYFKWKKFHSHTHPNPTVMRKLKSHVYQNEI